MTLHHRLRRRERATPIPQGDVMPRQLLTRLPVPGLSQAPGRDATVTEE
jgi:hypothetical protein